MEEFYEKPIMTNMVNIGYFIFSNEVFSLCNPNLMMEQEVLSKLSKDGRCGVHEHFGFWQPIDSLRDLNVLRDMIGRGVTPWRQNAKH